MAASWAHRDFRPTDEWVCAVGATTTARNAEDIAALNLFQGNQPREIQAFEGQRLALDGRNDWFYARQSEPGGEFTRIESVCAQNGKKLSTSD